MKKRNKIIMAIAIFMCLIVLIGANLNEHFGQVHTEITVTQSITIDHNPTNKPLHHSVTVYSGDSITFKHMVYNNAKTCNVSINQTTIGLITGLNLTIKYGNGSLVIFPFNLFCNSEVELQFIYDTDVNLKSKVYNVKTYFDVKEM